MKMVAAVVLSLASCSQGVLGSLVFTSQGGSISATMSNAGASSASTALPPATPFSQTVNSTFVVAGNGEIAHGSAGAQTSWSTSDVHFDGQISVQNSVPSSLSPTGVNQAISEGTFSFTLDAATLVHTTMGFSGSDSGNAFTQFTFHFDRILSGGTHQLIYSSAVDVFDTLPAGDYQMSVHGETFLSLTGSRVGTSSYSVTGSVVTVPGPGGVAVLGAAGVAALRRRRR